MPELAEVRLRENYRVTVHRRFAEAIFDTPLSIYEQRILYAVLSNIEPPTFKKDENNEFVLDENGNKIITNYITELPVFEMKLKEFGELIGLREIEYRFVRKIMKDFKKKGLEIHRLERPDHEINEKDYRGINFLLESEYLHQQGTIRLEFSPKLLPYVANLVGEFVSVPLSVITSFSSKYSTKLYFLMQQWKNVKHKEYEVDELKGLMGVPFEVKYQAGKPVKVYKLDPYFNFKHRALEPAISEINKFSDLDIQFQEIKTGRKIGKIKFIIGQSKAPAKKQSSVVEHSENTCTVQEYLAKEVFGNFGFGQMFFKNTAKSLNGISNLDADRELELKVYLGLQGLKDYFQSQKNLGEGYLITTIREMVEAYKEHGDFSFKNEFVRTEQLPEWFNDNETIKKSRIEFEQNQPFTVLRRESMPEPEVPSSKSPEAPSEDNKSNMEEEKQRILQQMELKKAKLRLESKYSKKD